MTITHTTTGYFEGLTLSKMEKLILWELGQVIGLDVSYDRFPQWLIRDKLNNRQNQFVFKSQCIKKTALLLAKEGYRQYKLPVNCMENGVLSVKYYYDSESYEDLEIVDKAYMNSRQPGYLTDSPGIPEYAFEGTAYGNIPMLEVNPPPDSDGTEYTASSDLGVVIGGSGLPTISNNISGQAIGGSTSTLQDTEVDFTTLGIVEGMAVVKAHGVTNPVTPGSEPIGYIDIIAANQLTFTAVMTNSGQFDPGDDYTILAGEYGVLTSWEDDDKIIFASEVGALSNITVPSGNFLVDYIPYPLIFPESGNDLQMPEIPKLYHHNMAMGVVADFLNSFHENTREFQRAERYETMFQNGVAEAMGLKTSRPFANKPVQMIPRKR